MSALAVSSVESTAARAAADIKTQLAGADPRFVLYFASSAFPAGQVSAEMQKAFGDVPTFGCTTAGEIVSGKMLKNSLVAMAIGKDMVKDVSVAVVSDLAGKAGLDGAIARFEKHFDTSISDMDLQEYVGIVLVDGLSGAEERLMDRLGDRTSLTFIGGSAGDDLKFRETHVFANGAAHAGAALLVLLRTQAGFDIIKTQSFNTLRKTLTATRVDEPQRTVIEFNGKPALAEYGRAAGAGQGQEADAFMRNPLGLMVDGEPYVRSPQAAAGGALKFYCEIKEGMELSVLESTDIVRDTRAAVQEKVNQLGDRLGAILNFNCILRTLELEQKKQTDAYGKIFADVNTVGFSTYGEQYLGHVNQTATMLVLRKVA